VLGGVGVDDAQAGVDVVDEHDADCWPASAAVMRSTCLVAPPAGELGHDRVGQRDARVGDEHRRGERVVLGLADQVGGDVGGVGGVVGEDRDLGGPGLGVDADHGP
jgi:hypothetical protein